MLAKLSVKKPYTVLVAVVLVIVLGVVSLSKMTTDLLPDMSFQYALIITTDVGASPEEVESDVTAPIEAAIATTSNIKDISSMSYNSYSLVICEYEQSANMDSVVIEIQQELDQLESSWSSSVGSPMIMQISPDMIPVMVAGVDVDGMDQSEIAIYVENDLIPALESVEGVASVSAMGELEEHVLVTLDQKKIDDLNAVIKEEIEDQFKDAQEELDDGKAQIEDGQSAMSSAGSQLSSAYNQVADKQSELASTKAQLQEQLSQLKTQKEALETVQSGISSFTGSSSYTMLKAMDSAVDYLDKAIDQLEKESSSSSEESSSSSDSGSSSEEGSSSQTDGSSEEGSTDEDDDETAGSSDSSSADSGSSSSADGSSAGSSTVPSEATITLAELISQLQKAGVDTSAMETVFEQLKENNITSLTAANLQTLRNTLASQINETNATIAQQFSAMSEMGVSVNSYQDLAEASGTVSSYLTQINTGIAAIESGLNQLEAGQGTVQQYIDMINQNSAIAALNIAPSAAQLAVAAASLETAQSSLDSAKDSALESADMNNILTIETLSGLLVAQNFDMPAGYVNDGDTQYLIHVGDKVSTLEELENLVLLDLGMDSVGVIRLCDVATIEIKDNSDETYAVINGNPGLILTMEKQTGYSTGDVTDRLLDRFDELEAEKEGLHMSVLMDQGVYIDMVVDSVLENMIIGGILAILVLLIFLKDIKPTLVIACSIPLSVIIAIVLMYFTGITLNIISMSGLMLGIGMLVDNSIVVIENIYRLRDEGLSVRKAAVEGANQVTGAIVASTLTTVSVYAPIVFTEGITRQLFVDLSLTVAFTLLASLAVAMFFVPAMASVILKRTKEIRHPWFEKFQNWYGAVLERCLKAKVLVLLAALAALIISGLASYSQGLSFMDMSMETNTVSVTLTAKEDQTLEFAEMCDLSDQAIERISAIEGVETVGAYAGGSSTLSLMSGGDSSVTMYVLMDEDSGISSASIAEQINSSCADLDCLVTASTASSMDYSSYFGEGISINIKGSDLDQLQSLAEQTAKILEETEGCIDIEDGLDNQTPQFTISVNKEKAAEYGYTVAQVFQLVYAKLADSSSATTLNTDIKDYEVYLQSAEQATVTLADIRDLTFTWTNKDGDEEEIPLADIVDMEETTTLSTIQRSSQSRYITVSCGVDDDHNVTLLSTQIQNELDKLALPTGYSVEMAGEDETINNAMEQLMLMLLLAVIFIYLIMVAQFQSLLSPFIIMFTIPLAFTGGFMALLLTGNVISVLAMLGFIMLAGVIVNNGIVLIDYINQGRREGLSKKEAIIEAGRTRLRPILMTALTTILAMSTSAIGLGSGSDMMKPMAITMVGGMVYGTILTLIVIPCVYDLFNRDKSMVDEEEL